MEFRVYAAFGYVTKVVEQWPPKRKRGTPCYFSQLVASLPRCVSPICNRQGNSFEKSSAVNHTLSFLLPGTPAQSIREQIPKKQ